MDNNGNNNEISHHFLASPLLVMFVQSRNFDYFFTQPISLYGFILSKMATDPIFSLSLILKFSAIDFAKTVERKVGTALPICRFLSLLEPKN